MGSPPFLPDFFLHAMNGIHACIRFNLNFIKLRLIHLLT